MTGLGLGLGLSLRRNKPGAGGGGGFSPPNLPSLSLWIDSSDAASITQSGGFVDQISDKSGNGKHMTMTSTQRPGTGQVINGLGAIDFDGTNDWVFGGLASNVTDNFSMYAIIRPDAVQSTNNGGAFFYNGTGANDGYGVSIGSPNGFVGFLRGGVAWHESTFPKPSSGTHLLSLIRTAGTWSLRYDGVEVLSVVGSAPNTPTARTAWGTHETFGNNYVNGQGGECLFYAAAHNATDRATVETYLAAKWGATVSTTGVPATLPNLLQWIDPADVATLQQSGGLVDQAWDKSGQSKHMPAITTARPGAAGVINSKNAMDFDGTTDRMIFPVAPITTIVDNFSMYCVVQPDAVNGAGASPYYNGNGGSNGYGIILNTSGGKVGLLRGGIAFHDSTQAAPSSGRHLISLIRTSGTWSLRYDGAEVLNIVGSAPTAPGSGTYLGSYDGTVFFNGQMGDQIFYTEAHDATKRGQIETYLSTKWGITLTPAELRVLNDTFTENPDKYIGAHSPDVGGPWLSNPATWMTDLATGRCYVPSNGGGGRFKCCVNVHGADQRILVASIGLAGASDRQFGPVIRGDGTLINCIQAYLSDTTIVLCKVIANVETTLGSWSHGLTIPYTLSNFELKSVGDVITLTIAGTVRATYTISGAEKTALDPLVSVGFATRTRAHWDTNTFVDGVEVFIADATPPPTIMQTKGSLNSLSVTPDSKPRDGNLLILAVSNPTALAGWTWPAGFTQVATGATGSGWNQAIAIKVASSESGAYTMAGTFGTGNAHMDFIEINFPAAASQFDVSNTQVTAGATTLTPLTASTAVANSIAIGMLLTGSGVGSIAWTNGFSPVRADDSKTSIQFKKLETTQTVTSVVSWSPSTDAVALIAVLKGI